MCYDFEDSLVSIPIHLTSVETGKREHVFSTNDPTGGGVHIILFVSLIVPSYCYTASSRPSSASFLLP